MKIRQRPSTAATRYSIADGKRPKVSDGYHQRIDIWDAIKSLGSTNRSELFRELQKRGHARPMNAVMNEAYCRIELTDMCRRGFLVRLAEG